MLFRSKYIGKLDRRNGEKQLVLPACVKGSRLDILVEAMGRINFGRAIKDFKGITKNVELSMDINGYPFVCDLKNWEVFNIEDTYEFYQGMKFQPIESLTDRLGQRIPGVYRAKFQVKKPSDTFLNFETWGKGLVYVASPTYMHYTDRKSTRLNSSHPSSSRMPSSA